jgi:hypothetical protein
MCSAKFQLVTELLMNAYNKMVMMKCRHSSELHIEWADPPSKQSYQLSIRFSFRISSEWEHAREPICQGIRRRIN